MRIPMSQIQAASASALPQQAARVTTSSSSAITPSSASTLESLTEKLSQSNKTGDRDAQEQYLGTESKKRKDPEKSGAEEAPPESPAASIWNLAVDDDSPPSDLDIRG
jgi:hypothetical protein